MLWMLHLSLANPRDTLNVNNVNQYWLCLSAQAEEAILDMLPALFVDVPAGVSTTLVADYL